MSLKYLLDTNIISQAMRPSPNQNTIERLAANKLEIATATVVVHELLYGCFRLPESKKRRAFLEYIEEVVLHLPIFDYDLRAAQWHAEERARLSKVGKIPAYADGQIASIASRNNLILVTNNVDDFQDFNGLVIENWLD